MMSEFRNEEGSLSCEDSQVSQGGVRADLGREWEADED